MLFCIRLPNLVQIGTSTAEIWRHIDCQDGDRQPCCIYFGAMADHPRSAFRDLNSVLKSRVRRINSSGDCIMYAVQLLRILLHEFIKQYAMVHFVKCESQINSLDAYWTAFYDSLGGGSTSTRRYNAKLQRKNGIWLLPAPKNDTHMFITKRCLHLANVFRIVLHVFRQKYSVLTQNASIKIIKSFILRFVICILYNKWIMISTHANCRTAKQIISIFYAVKPDRSAVQWLSSRTSEPGGLFTKGRKGWSVPRPIVRLVSDRSWYSRNKSHVRSS